MANIKSKIQSIKDYFRERARVRSLWKSCTFLIRTEKMAAAVRSYIRELEAKVKAQAVVIRSQSRQLRDAAFAETDLDLDRIQAAKARRRLAPDFVAEQIERPALMRFPSGGTFAPGWTGNDLIDARHMSDLLSSGCRVESVPAGVSHRGGN